MLIDSHLHLPHKKYNKSSKEIVEEAKEAGIDKLITIGTSIKDSKKAVETAEEFENVYATVGIYPHDDKNSSVGQLRESLTKLQKSSNKIVGIGECGIDITNWDGGRSLEDQIELFEMQIVLAVQNKLPLVIHNRNGDEHVIGLLKKYTNQGLAGVAHCFVGNWELAKNYLELGFYISFSGIITYPSGKEILETVKNVPNDKFLLETDAPYLSPQEHRGETNHPKYVKITARKAAAVKEMSYEDVCEHSYNNTCRLFGL